MDINNNRNTGRYYVAGTGGNGNATGLCPKNGNNHGSNHIYTNKVLPSSLMTKYTNAGSYMHGGGGGGNTMMTPHLTTHDTHNNPHNHHNNHTAVTQAYYSNHSNPSSYGYQRNRYMPYNRGNNGSTQMHQPIHTTTATISTSVLTNSANYSQFPTPIYQTCQPGLGQTITSATPLPTAAVQAPLHNHNLATTTASQCAAISSQAEFTYAHAVASSLAPNTVTTNVTNSSDNKNSSVSLATVVTSSGSSAVTGGGGGGTVMSSTPYAGGQSYATVSDPNDTVTLQITNLDFSMDEASLRNFLLNQLKPITPVVSLTFEGSSYAKVTVPDLYVSK